MLFLNCFVFLVTNFPIIFLLDNVQRMNLKLLEIVFRIEILNIKVVEYIVPNVIMEEEQGMLFV